MCLRIITCLCFLLSILSLCFGQTSTTTPTPPVTTAPFPTDKMEESVLSSMLKIVDEKFDTLSARISQMERAVNGLQFFSIRKFRGLTNTLQTSAALTQAMHTKLGANDLETRTIKSTVTRMSHDVAALKESNSKMFTKLERSVLYINRNVDEKTSDIKSTLEILEKRNEEKAKQMEEVVTEHEFVGKRETVLNCTVDVKVLEEQLDIAFNHLRNQSHFQYEKLRNQSEVHFNKLKFQSQQQFETVRQEAETRYKKQNHLSELHYDKLKNQSQIQYDNLKRQSLTQYTRLSNISMPRHDGRPSQSLPSEDAVFIDNEKLFLALTNLTSHVVQSVSFMRHTESMLETIISNTDTVAYEQEQLRKDVVEVVSKSQGPDDTKDPQSNIITEGGTNIAQGQGQVRDSDAQSTGCTLPDNVLNDIATFSKNGSQLFEILTDLAQMSQVSLSASIVELQDELLRMEETRVKMEAETKLPPSYAPGDYNLVLQKILNTSRNTLKMAEAMASNTGYIPYIFHNVQYVEGQLNRSMSVTTRFLSEIRGLKGQLIRSDPNAHTQGSSFNVPNAGTDGDRRNGSNMAQEDVLEFIYDTSVKLKRIMPALTRLIAEPEPLITLVDGRKADEGRVEIFHKGQWGTICDSKLGHAEASAICRHLGYVGGISAGRGQFGPGSGVTWAFNLTCLRTLQCPAISEQAEGQSCSHRGDFGVICDHMLRLVPLEGNNDVSTGHIEIYQKSRWRPVCGHGFGRNEAQVSCRQMGYSTGWMRDFRGRLRDSTSVWMTNVQCRGTENRLDACRHNNFGQRPCPGHTPASVTCE